MYRFANVGQPAWTGLHRPRPSVGRIKSLRYWKLEADTIDRKAKC